MTVLPRSERRRGRLVPPALLAALLTASPTLGGAARWSSLSPRLGEVVNLGRAAPETMRHVVVGLERRDRDGLEALLARAHDPASPEFHRFLSPAELTAMHAPTAEAEAAVIAHREMGDPDQEGDGTWPHLYRRRNGIRARPRSSTGVAALR